MLSELVGLDTAADDAVPPMAPNKQRARTLAVLSDYLIGPGAVPALICVEDAHWADPSTIELIGQLLATGDRQMLLLVTAREDFAHPWTIDLHLRLGPLDADASRALLTATAGQHGHR